MAVTPVFERRPVHRIRPIGELHTFLGHQLRATAKSAAASLAMLGMPGARCQVPGVGFCPWGAWGGTDKQLSWNANPSARAAVAQRHVMPRVLSPVASLVQFGAAGVGVGRRPNFVCMPTVAICPLRTTARPWTAVWSAWSLANSNIQRDCCHTPTAVNQCQGLRNMWEFL